MDNRRLKIVISGGGTGGHLFPALAIADALKKRQPNCQLHFIGSKFGMEAKHYPKREEAFSLLNIRGIVRGKSFSGLLRNLFFPFRFFHSYLKSWWILTQFHPDVVVGTGGYASGLPLLVAIHKRIPTLIHEQNSYPGFTTRWLSDRVDSVCISYPTSEFFLKKKTLFLQEIP